MRESLPSLADAAKRSAPPVAVGFWDIVLGLPVEKWVHIATLLFILLQAALLLHNHFAPDRRRGKDK